MGAKVKKLTDQSNKNGVWVFFCPACGYGHSFDDRWTFNGDVEKPTFSPSLLVYGSPEHVYEGKSYKGTPQCHSFVVDGYMQYQGDCGHAMNGQTIEIPDYDDW